MQSVITRPTPQHVLDAIHIVAAWLREIDAVEALISPEGGAAFHEERLVAKYLDGWGECEAKLESARARITDLEGALMEYGEHDPACERRMDDHQPCSCGLHTALDDEACVWCTAGHTIVEDGYHWFDEHAKRPCKNAARRA